MSVSRTRSSLTALPVALALILAGCGEEPPATSAPSSAPAPDTISTTSAPQSSQGGFGAPAAAPGEFDPLPGIEMVGLARLEPNGCWYLAGDGDSALLIAPTGTELGSDGHSLITPDGTVIESGLAVDTTGGLVALDQLPGGADGKWGNYASFCKPTNGFAIVADSLVTSFDPSDVDPAALADELDESVFDTDFGCGYGFTTGAANGRWALSITSTTGTPPDAGPVVLPDDRFDVSVTAGAHLFSNHCDDVAEWFEPAYTPAVTWDVTTGTFTYPGGSDEMCSGGPPETITLVDATVDTPVGPVVLAPIEITNDAFGCFAG